MASKYANVGLVLVTFLRRPRPGAQWGGEETAGNRGGGTQVSVTHSWARIGLQAGGRRSPWLAPQPSALRTGPPARHREGVVPWVAPAWLMTWGNPHVAAPALQKIPGSNSATARICQFRVPCFGKVPFHLGGDSVFSFINQALEFSPQRGEPTLYHDSGALGEAWHTEGRTRASCQPLFFASLSSPGPGR